MKVINKIVELKYQLLGLLVFFVMMVVVFFLTPGYEHISKYVYDYGSSFLSLMLVFVPPFLITHLFIIAAILIRKNHNFGSYMVMAYLFIISITWGLVEIIILESVLKMDNSLIESVKAHGLTVPFETPPMLVILLTVGAMCLYYWIVYCMVEVEIK